MAESKLMTNAAPPTPMALPGVTVLMYHGLCRQDGAHSEVTRSKYDVNAGDFREQMSLVKRVAGKTLRLEEFWKMPPAERSQTLDVVLTFDDGRVSDYETAFPILAELGLSATFFLNPANVEHAGYLSWRQIHEMSRAGMSFQSHGMDHVNMSALKPAQLQYQLSESRDVLEFKIGQPVRFLAVPFGLITGHVITAALEEGYSAVCSSRNWPALPGGQTINRCAVYQNTSILECQQLIEKAQMMFWKRALRDALLHYPKRVMLKLKPGFLLPQEEGARV